MSQYIHFFIKAKDDYYPIGTYSRSDIIYQIFNEIAPYEKIRAITGDELNTLISEAKDEIEYNRSQIAAYNEKIEWLKGAHLELDECLDTLEEYMQYRNDHERTIKEIESGISFINHLKAILEDAYDDNHYTDDVSRFWIGEDAYIYFGIECGNPNLIYDDDGWNEVIENRISGYVRKKNEGSE